MRIGICARTWGEKGGIGTYTRLLLQTMLPLASEHQFYIFYGAPEHVGRFAHLPNVTEILLRSPSTLLWDQVATAKQAAKLKLDVIFHPKMAVPLMAGCKTVTVLHGTERFVYPQFSHKSDMLYFQTLYRLYMKRATAILSVSHNAARDLVQFLRLDARKVSTVHLAPAPYFRKIDDPQLIQKVRRKYDLPSRFILNVGLIYPGKNIPNLLKALKLAREKEDVKLVIAGGGRRLYTDELRRIDDLGLRQHVFLIGYVPHEDLPAVYSTAEALVFPSFYESFGLVSLEAMACGCPVVTSLTGGTREAAGDAAIYVRPGDETELARAILRVLTEPELRSALREKGFQNAKRFSWEKTAQETLGVLQSV
jgi:glycosyltransferase involved in cell wall biosynthesis